jgi:hypothetical protein
MSLIQKALERTHQSQELRTTTSVPAPKPYERDPMGIELEQTLTQVQQDYARRRKWVRRSLVAVLFVGVALILALVVFHNQALTPAGSKEKNMSQQTPVRIQSGYIYRLTGISEMDNRAVAVINNRIVSVGDTLNKRATVKAIGDGEVRLDVQGKEIILTL